MTTLAVKECTNRLKDIFIQLKTGGFKLDFDAFTFL